ncbi:MAG: hypothetical protein Q9211_000864 [Gyalolechia sp. 1 TL-2023]
MSTAAVFVSATSTTLSPHIDSGRLELFLLDPLPKVSHHVKIVEAPNYAQTRKPMRSNLERTESTTASHSSREPADGGSSGNQVRQSIFSRITKGHPNVFGLRNPWRARVASPPETESQAEERSPSSLLRTVPEDNRPKDDYEEYHDLFIPSMTRLPAVDYQDLLSRAKKRKPMCHAQHTAYAQIEMMCTHKSQAGNPGAKIVPLQYLLRIILQDTLTILRSINLALTDIDGSMLDDERLQSGIDSWRRILHRFETELRHLETSIPEFARYVVNAEGASGTGICGELLGQCTLQITKAQERRTTTYKSLMTAMSLVESKRGISEAESVTKLTELAFFFIPLTFAASLFSMQVKELDADTTSVGVFFGVALTITACSYVLRLAIRSSAFVSFLRRWKDDIRISTDSSSGAPIATTMVLKWMRRRLSWCLYPASVMIPTAALLAGLWTRSLQDGIKAGESR